MLRLQISDIKNIRENWYKISDKTDIEEIKKQVESDIVKGTLYCWEIGKKKHEMIGKIDGIIRGLGNGESNHFISKSDEFIRLHKIIKDDEFSFS